ncbi:MAG: glycosyl hydrolase [Acidobacteriota bacterium]|nr:glycosyl hydrolase [Acidobacteriota bacterium]
MYRMQRYLTGLLLAGLSLAPAAVVAAPVPPAQLTGALHWRSVGPYVGGRVVAVTGVAQEPNVYYMGSTGGGVWKSTDYGIHWTNVSDKYFDNSNIGAIAVAPSDPKVIYVGTGEPDIRNTMLTGDGMYKSTDAGKTWKKIGLADTHVISRIVVDPNNPEVVYVAAMGHVFADNAERGVFKSTDGGQTWKKILYVDEKTGAIDLVMDPANPDTLYAAMWQAFRTHWTFSSGGPGSGIYKTTDGGAKWTNVTHATGLPTGIFGRVGLAIAPSNPSVMYAIIQAHYKDQAGGLFRSADGGKSWTMVNNSMDLTQRAFYYSTVYVDPKDPNTIYLPQVAALWVSRDGGKKIDRLRPPHGDNHALWINPNNPDVMIEANDGGATVTRDGGRNWSSEHNQPTGQFYHVNLDEQFPFHMYGAQQDEASGEGPSAVAAGSLPPVWTPVQGGEASWVVPEPGKPWITIASGYYSALWRDDRRTGLVTQISPWPSYQFGLAGQKIKFRYGWNHHPILFAPGNPQELLTGANVVFETLDDGIHWKQISPDLTRNDKTKQERPGGPISADVTGEEMFDTLSSVAVSPLSDDIIWAGADDGEVHVTTDGGAHWTEARPANLPTWSTITCIEPSHTDKGTAYLSASRFDWDDFHPYVYKTTDYGKTWTALTAGLPDNQYVESVRQDPNEPNLMFVGTSATVFMSLDGGAHWLPLGLNLPAVRVNDIGIQAAQHAVVLGTHGRAFWVLDNLQFLEQLSSAQVSTDAAYLFKPQQTWLVTRRGGFGGPGEGGQNLPAGATVFFHLPADYNGQTPVKLSFTDAAGHVIRSFTLPLKPAKSVSPFGGPARKPAKLHPGMNSFQWDLRYPTATDVKGIFNSGFSAAVPVGPEVVPGTYDAVLTYGSTTLKQPFEVKLDPRLDTTQAQLQQRFDLLMQIHDAINTLSTTLNEAIDTRDALDKAVAGKSVTASAAQPALAALNREIDDLVDLKIQSGEGALVYPPRLRSWLSAIDNQVSMAFVAPTPAMVEVANGYLGMEKTGVERLKTDIAHAKALMKH